MQLVFATETVNLAEYNFDLEAIKAEALREIEGDEKAELEDAVMNENVMNLINEGTPMDENFYLNQPATEEKNDTMGIRSTNRTDLSKVRQSELDTDRTDVRGREEQEAA